MFNLLPPQVKLYAELAAAFAICALLMWGIHHLREQGREEIRAAQAQLVQARIVHNAEVETRAKTIADESLARYKNSLGAPPPSDALTVRVCKPSNGGALRGDASPRPLTDAGGRLSAGVEEGRDIGPFTEQLFARCNAKVKALQEYIATERREIHGGAK